MQITNNAFFILLVLFLCSHSIAQISILGNKQKNINTIILQLKETLYKPNNNKLFTNALKTIQELVDNLTKEEEIKLTKNESFRKSCQNELVKKKEFTIIDKFNFEKSVKEIDQCKNNFDNSIEMIKLENKEKDNYLETFKNTENIRARQKEIFSKIKANFDTTLSMLENINGIITNNSKENLNSSLSQFSSKLFSSAIHVGITNLLSLSQTLKSLNQISMANKLRLSIPMKSTHSFLQISNKKEKEINPKNNSENINKLLNTVKEQTKTVYEKYIEKEKTANDNFEVLKQDLQIKLENIEKSLSQKNTILEKSTKCLENSELKQTELSQKYQDSTKQLQNTLNVCNSFEKEYQVSKNASNDNINELNILKNILLEKIKKY